MTDTLILVASHNIERGKAPIEEIRSAYGSIVKKLPRPMDVLCLQEQQRNDGTYLADRLHVFVPHARAARGTTYYDDGRGTMLPDFPQFADPAIIWNPARLTATYRFIQPITRLEQYGPLGRIFGSDSAQQRKAVGARFSLAGGTPFDVISFHLDAWGGNALKRAQLASISAGRDQYGGTDLDGNPITDRRIFCGDTNIYARAMLPSQRLQRRALREILAEQGLHDPGTKRTHHFERIPTKTLSGKLIRAANTLHLLVPSRFDTVASNMTIVEQGVIETPFSDHDLVWAIVDVG